MTIYTNWPPSDDDLQAAQAILDSHLIAFPSGRCKICDILGPCPEREGALIVFNRANRLAQRRVSVRQPEVKRVHRVR